MKKVVGYIIAILGLVVMVVSLGFLSLEKYIDLTFLDQFPTKYVTIAGIVLVILGSIFAYSTKGIKTSGKGLNKKKEVPIYEGSEIVGYRRHN